jgi:AcrR family transcriptional regulator
MLSLRELSRVVGVSHTSPRRHFADRQALLDALARTGFQRLDATLARVAKGRGRNFSAQLRPMSGSR